MESTELHLRIKLSREQSKLTQAMLAVLVGVKRSSANQWESPNLGKEPSTSNLIKIALITGVSFEWLATGRGEMLWHERSAEDFGGLSAREKFLLKLFAELTERRQKALLAFLNDK